MVKDGKDDTKEHLAYAKNDSQLHLVGVSKDKLIIGNTPDLTCILHDSMSIQFIK